MYRLIASLISTAAVSCFWIMHLTPTAIAQDKAAQREAYCATKKNKVERNICNDRDLTRRDAYLNEVYQDVRNKLSKQDFKQIRKDQRAWIKQRNTCGDNSQCIADKYEDRTAEIEQMLENIENPNKSHVEIGCTRPDQEFVNGVCLTRSGETPFDGENLVWHTSAFNDPANKGRYTATLRYGVPETDNVAFEAICSPGGSAKFATTLITYNPGQAKEGTNVALEVRTGKKTRPLSSTSFFFGS